MPHAILLSSPVSPPDPGSNCTLGGARVAAQTDGAPPDQHVGHPEVGEQRADADSVEEHLRRDHLRQVLERAHRAAPAIPRIPVA